MPPYFSLSSQKPSDESGDMLQTDVAGKVVQAGALASTWNDGTPTAVPAAPSVLVGARPIVPSPDDDAQRPGAPKLNRLRTQEVQEAVQSSRGIVRTENKR